MKVASGRTFSSVPVRFWAAEPSPQSIVAESASSQPGSRIVPATVTAVFSVMEARSLTSIVGAMLLTVTTAVSSAVRPVASATQTFTVVVLSLPTAVNAGVESPEESSQTPSPSRSQV